MVADVLESCVPTCLDIHHWMELCIKYEWPAGLCVKYEFPGTAELSMKYEIAGTAGLYYRDHELLLAVIEHSRQRK